MILGFPGDSEVKNPPANAGGVGLIPGSGRSSAGENGNPLQSSLDRGAWRTTAHGSQESDVTEQAIRFHNLYAPS